VERRYDDLLTARIEDAINNGVSHITWNELYLWYGVQKIAANTWRDLNARMKEIRPHARPSKIEGRGGIFIFDSVKRSKMDPDTND
jgi:hypothetical protein